MAYELCNRSILYAIIIVLALLDWDEALLAQVSEGGSPYSFSNIIADTVPTVRMDSVDVAALLAKIPFHREPYFSDSGLHDGPVGPGARTIVAFRELIQFPGAPWLQLRLHVDHPDNIRRILP